MFFLSFQELVKYSLWLQEDASYLQRALELMLSVPHRATDDKFTSSIEGYRGSIYKLGRLLAHDWYSITKSPTATTPVAVKKERYLFLFKARILVCKVKRISEDRSVFQLKDIIKVRIVVYNFLFFIFTFRNRYVYFFHGPFSKENYSGYIYLHDFSQKFNYCYLRIKT